MYRHVYSTRWTLEIHPRKNSVVDSQSDHYKVGPCEGPLDSKVGFKFITITHYYSYLSIYLSTYLLMYVCMHVCMYE